MTRNNFYTNIGLVFIKKILEFRHIIEHERVLTKLNLYQYFFSDKIYLFICTRNND